MKLQIFAFATAALLLASCNDDDDNNTTDPLPIPAAYDGANFDANTTVQTTVLTNLNTQVAAAKQGRIAGTVVAIDALVTPYTTGTPSVRDVSTSYFVEKMEGPTGYMNELANSSGTTYTPGDMIGEGGVYGLYLFDETGLEMEQLIEKGQFGAVLYNHFTALISGPISAETLDQMVSIFGAHPSFPNTNNAANAEFPDRFMANYAARRDKADGAGLYTQMKSNFIKLQAAVKAGSAYDAEKQEAVNALKLTWEKINAGTIINYCHGATSTLSESAPSDDQKSGALHAIGEAIGFSHGWKTIASDAKIISDAEIDEVLVLLNAPHDAPSDVYTFVTDPLNELPNLQEVITKLQNIYGFTDQEIDDFRFNWVNVQGR
jgi:hypothetical protein